MTMVSQYLIVAKAYSLAIDLLIVLSNLNNDEYQLALEKLHSLLDTEIEKKLLNRDTKLLYEQSISKNSTAEKLYQAAKVINYSHTNSAEPFFYEDIHALVKKIKNDLSKIKFYKDLHPSEYLKRIKLLLEEIGHEAMIDMAR